MVLNVFHNTFVSPCKEHNYFCLSCYFDFNTKLDAFCSTFQRHYLTVELRSFNVLTYPPLFESKARGVFNAKPHISNLCLFELSLTFSFLNNLGKNEN